ncbi:MAG: hypothetical protein ACI4P1_03180 [Erysipelotrichaceae bacterium]
MPIYLIKDEGYIDIQRCYEVYRKDDIRNIFDDVKDNHYQSIAISLFVNSDDNLYDEINKLNLNDADIYLFSDFVHLFNNDLRKQLDTYIDIYYEKPEEIYTECTNSFYGLPASLECECKIAFKPGISTLDDQLNNLDESFAEMLFRKIDERELSDPEVYKGANIDRRLFSKIRSNLHYHPSKSTALALAISLKLSYDETEKLLKCAGYAFSKSERFDVIVEYFIKNEIYDVYLINEALFEYDERLLGNL